MACRVPGAAGVVTADQTLHHAGAGSQPPSSTNASRWLTRSGCSQLFQREWSLGTIRVATSVKCLSCLTRIHNVGCWQRSHIAAPWIR
jgi:hypothetical protein